MRIDAHQHFWRVARGDYGWLTADLGPIHRDFDLPDLAPLLAASGISGTVLVQAAPTEAETRFLLRLAAESAGVIGGVVGWVDFEAADVRERLERLAGNPLLCGVRPMIQDIADTDWMLDRRLDGAFRAIIDLDLRFDALVQPRHLVNLRRLLDRHPDLRTVVDHGAKPGIASGAREPWAADIRALARETAAWCKLSGLATEAKPDWTTADLEPYAAHLLDCFGPHRLIWGSDWPVLNLAGGYERWWSATTALLRGLLPAERDAILGGNAERFYGLQHG